MTSFHPGSLIKNFDKIEVLSWMTRTALELIGQSGFGYSFDSLTEDGKQHIFSKAIKELSYVWIGHY